MAGCSSTADTALDRAPRGPRRRRHTSTARPLRRGRAACTDRPPGQDRRGRSQLRASTPPSRASRRRDDPILFTKYSSSIVGDGAEIVWRAGDTAQVDYEAELAVVIGRLARDVPDGARARRRPRLHVPGRRVGARPPVRRRAVDPRQEPRHVLPDGPVDRDRATRSRTRRRCRIRCRVNGEVVQDASTATMIHGVAELIAFMLAVHHASSPATSSRQGRRAASASSASRPGSSPMATRWSSRSRGSGR